MTTELSLFAKHLVCFSTTPFRQNFSVVSQLLGARCFCQTQTRDRWRRWQRNTQERAQLCHDHKQPRSVSWSVQSSFTRMYTVSGWERTFSHSFSTLWVLPKFSNALVPWKSLFSDKIWSWSVLHPYRRYRLLAVHEPHVTVPVPIVRLLIY